MKEVIQAALEAYLLQIYREKVEQLTATENVMLLLKLGAVVFLLHFVIFQIPPLRCLLRLLEGFVFCLLITFIVFVVILSHE